MTTITDFAGVHDALRPYAMALPKAGVAYTLTRMRVLMTALGNPQDSLKIVHVAGTSGKTSTSYYVAAMLQQAGQLVGLTVSPHLAEINERLQINLLPVSEAAFCTALAEFLALLQTVDVVPTFYELLIAFAYWYFAQQKVDYAVIEVGLGGLLDSTNVCARTDKICVITDIGLDHTQILGIDLPSITTQKAGIIQPGNAVVCFKQSAAVDAVISEHAKAAQGTLAAYDYQALPVTNLTLFQQRNWQLAAHVYDYAQQRDGLAELTFGQWQQTQLTYIPGRMEVIRHGTKIVVLDGAHNPQKMQTLVASLLAQFPQQPMAALVAVKATKDIAATLEPLLATASHVIATEFMSGYGQAYTSVKVTEIMTVAGPDAEAIADLPTAVRTLLKRPEPLLVVTGSLYLLQQARQVVKNC